MLRINRVNWRFGFEGVRLPAAPPLPLDDLWHGWKPCPFKTKRPRFIRCSAVPFKVQKNLVLAAERRTPELILL